MRSPQFAHALALAAHHHHFWPGVVAEGEEPSWAAIQARCEAAFRQAREDHGDGPWCSGVLPAFDAQGTLHHTTMTGRLRYAVAPDGAVDLWVTRPGGRMVLQSSVYQNARLGWLVSTNVSQGVYGRHYHAWRVALRAVARAGLLPLAEVERAERLALPALEDLPAELEQARSTLAYLLDPSRSPDVLNREQAVSDYRRWIADLESVV